MRKSERWSRRNFLKAGLGLGGALLGESFLSFEARASNERLANLSYEFDRGEPESQKVSITVDDCYDWESSAIPGRVGTRTVVEAMAELGVPITYFPVGSSLRFNTEGWKGAWDTYSESGLFELQNHTQTHQFLTDLTAGEIRWQLSEWAQSFHEATGTTWGDHYPPVIRYPGGKRNDLVLQESHTVGADGAAFWSFASSASIKKTSPEEELQRIRKHLESEEFKTGGSILLFHDLAIDLEVLRQLPALLEELQLQPVLLSQLPGTVAYQGEQ